VTKGCTDAIQITSHLEINSRMEFERTPDGQIQASWACRIGKILNQYKVLTSELASDQKFEATLTITLLNGLLCYAKELIDSKNNQSFLNLFSLRNGELIHFSDPKTKPTDKLILDCLRNAISHPLGNQSDRKQIKVTGFSSYTEINANGESVVAGFVFTQSPCLKNNGEIWRKKKPFGLKDRLKFENQRYLLDGKELNEPPYIQLMFSLSRLSNLVSSLSAELSSSLNNQST
jgi:hypothetical protein